jgi:hypothetical protein
VAIFGRTFQRLKKFKKETLAIVLAHYRHRTVTGVNLVGPVGQKSSLLLPPPTPPPPPNSGKREQGQTLFPAPDRGSTGERGALTQGDRRRGRMGVGRITVLPTAYPKKTLPVMSESLAGWYNK